MEIFRGVQAYLKARKARRYKEEVECLSNQAFREIMDRIENHSYGPLENGSVQLDIPVIDRLAADAKAGRVTDEMFREVAQLAIDKVNAIIER